MTDSLPPPTPPPPPGRGKPLSLRFAELPTWARVGIIVGVSAAGFVAFAWGDDAFRSTPDAPSESSAAFTVTVDKCTFDTDGWTEAGGFVTNTGDSTDNVVVNLLVNGKYVDRDYVVEVEPGQSKSWSVSEAGTLQGTCTATTE